MSRSGDLESQESEEGEYQHQERGGFVLNAGEATCLPIRKSRSRGKADRACILVSKTELKRQKVKKSGVGRVISKMGIGLFAKV